MLHSQAVATTTSWNHGAVRPHHHPAGPSKLFPPSALRFSSLRKPDLPVLSSLPLRPAPPSRHFSTLAPAAASDSSVPENNATSSSSSTAVTAFHGPCYVLADNIDTDQIIPAEHLTLVPSKPDEYAKLGSLAMIGLPSALYPVPFVEPGATNTRYPIIIAGANFGCGSSREHAPVALGASGVRVVVAESYARIFFRNSVATGEVYPVESEHQDIYTEFTTGDIVTVDLAENKLINHTAEKLYNLKPIGDAGPVIEAGGIFAYARKVGMIKAA